jgi:hypothetical protein
MAWQLAQELAEVLGHELDGATAEVWVLEMETEWGRKLAQALVLQWVLWWVPKLMEMVWAPKWRGKEKGQRLDGSLDDGKGMVLDEELVLWWGKEQGGWLVPRWKAMEKEDGLGFLKGTGLDQR